MYCRKCGASIQDDANFCPKCGVAIEAATADAERHCWKCGARLQHDAEYIPNCGVTVPQWDDTHCQKCGALLADEAKFCHVCGASVTRPICIEPNTPKHTEQAESSNINYCEAQAPETLKDKSDDTPSKADNAPEKKSKGDLSEFFHVLDGKSLGYVVWIFPFKLLLLYIAVVFTFITIFNFLLPPSDMKTEEFYAFIFIITFGIVYPSAIMTTAIKSKENNVWKLLAEAAAICIAVFFVLVIIAFITIAEWGWNLLYGVLYLALALVVLYKVASIPKNQ